VPLTHSETVGAVVGCEDFEDDPQPLTSTAASTAAHTADRRTAATYSPRACAIVSRSAGSISASAPARYRSSSTGADQL
jgi:hypothetical protein